MVVMEKITPSTVYTYRSVGQGQLSQPCSIPPRLHDHIQLEWGVREWQQERLGRRASGNSKNLLGHMSCEAEVLRKGCLLSCPEPPVSLPATAHPPHPPPVLVKLVSTDPGHGRRSYYRAPLLLGFSHIKVILIKILCRHAQCLRLRPAHPTGSAHGSRLGPAPKTHLTPKRGQSPGSQLLTLSSPAGLPTDML